MPNHLSVLGIIHTAISIFAIVAAIVALLRYGRISPATGSGKLYVVLTILTCITGFPIMKTGHPTPGHFLGIIILVLLPAGIYTRQLRIFGKAADYFQVILISTTLFLSCIPAVVETTTRLPISHPLASGPNDPLIPKCLMVVLVVYLIGVTYQLVKLKALRKTSLASIDTTS